ncbi:MAG: nucleotidyl transferase AbiEii/AbiGii toxin family protein [Candidatus Magasanikbacteria bacterium]|nr:nucleotidyl transferase AbiEii/AbiGii toxin family protein [Candidatus Magasanikbacteria bacterium]
MEKKEILTKDQRKVLELFAGDAVLRDTFYLAGGTALSAFYLHHRLSDDLDFFTDKEPLPRTAVETFIHTAQKAVGAREVVYQRVHDRRIFFLKCASHELKMEFTLYPFPALKKRIRRKGVLVDSLQDIAAGKCMALQDRLEAKDFVDLYFLYTEKKMTTPALVKYVKKKFAFTLEPLMVGSMFAKVRHITMMPRIVKPLTLKELQTFFAARAQELEKDILE